MIFNLHADKCVAWNISYFFARFTVQACASIISASGLKAFVDLRDASKFVTIEFKAKTIVDSLFNAIWQRQGSSYHILCAVDMLLSNGSEGLLNELLKPKNIQELAKCFDDKEHVLLMETQQLLAKRVYVGPFWNISKTNFSRGACVMLEEVLLKCGICNPRPNGLCKGEWRQHLGFPLWYVRLISLISPLKPFEERDIQKSIQVIRDIFRIKYSKKFCEIGNKTDQVECMTPSVSSF